MAFGEQHDLPLICFASQNRSGLHNALPVLCCFSDSPPCAIPFCHAGQFFSASAKGKHVRAVWQLYCSSVHIYRPTQAYEQALKTAEGILMAFGEQHGLPFTCFASQNRIGLHNAFLFYGLF